VLGDTISGSENASEFTVNRDDDSNKSSEKNNFDGE
jgi:hypothetical protein